MGVHQGSWTRDKGRRAAGGAGREADPSQISGLGDRGPPDHPEAGRGLLPPGLPRTGPAQLELARETHIRLPACKMQHHTLLRSELMNQEDTNPALPTWQGQTLSSETKGPGSYASCLLPPPQLPLPSCGWHRDPQLARQCTSGKTTAKAGAIQPGLWTSV